MPVMKAREDQEQNEHGVGSSGVTVSHPSGAVYTPGATTDDLAAQKQGIDANDPEAADRLAKANETEGTSVQILPADRLTDADVDRVLDEHEQLVKDNEKKQDSVAQIDPSGGSIGANPGDPAPAHGSAYAQDTKTPERQDVKKEQVKATPGLTKKPSVTQKDKE